MLTVITKMMYALALIALIVLMIMLHGGVEIDPDYLELFIHLKVFIFISLGALLAASLTYSLGAVINAHIVGISANITSISRAQRDLIILTSTRRYYYALFAIYALIHCVVFLADYDGRYRHVQGVAVETVLGIFHAVIFAELITSPLIHRVKTSIIERAEIEGVQSPQTFHNIFG